LFSVDISFLETIAALSRQLGRRDADLDLLLPSNRKTVYRPCPCAEETLRLAIDQEEVIARDYGIQRKKGNGGSQHEG
jgi:hypothetical protein